MSEEKPLAKKAEKKAVARLDLRQTKCPLNFVKAKLALEKLPSKSPLEIWLAAEGESALNIPQSLQQEGHTLISQTLVSPPQPNQPPYLRLLVAKA